MRILTTVDLIPQIRNIRRNLLKVRTSFTCRCESPKLSFQTDLCQNSPIAKKLREAVQDYEKSDGLSLLSGLTLKGFRVKTINHDSF